MNQAEVLLVEDNENDAELAIRALQKNIGNIIFRVKDGPEALDYLFSQGVYAQRPQENMPKFILLDLKLPKLNGLEVLKKIKEDVRTQKIPVIMLTSSKEDPDIENAYAEGANSYIVKPVESESFLNALKSIGHYWTLFNQTPKEYKKL